MTFDNFTTLDKWDIKVSGDIKEDIFIKVGNDLIKYNNEVKLLGVKLDSKLKFTEHVSTICNKAGRKLTVLNRLGKYISMEKRRILYKTFIESQFNYSPLIWMFCSRKLNTKINKLQERSLRLVYNDYHSFFTK